MSTHIYSQKPQYISTNGNPHNINTYKHILLTSNIPMRNITDVNNRTTPMLTYFYVDASSITAKTFAGPD